MRPKIRILNWYPTFAARIVVEQLVLRSLPSSSITSFWEYSVKLRLILLCALRQQYHRKYILYRSSMPTYWCHVSKHSDSLSSCYRFSLTVLFFDEAMILRHYHMHGVLSVSVFQCFRIMISYFNAMQQLECTVKNTTPIAYALHEYMPMFVHDNLKMTKWRMNSDCWNEIEWISYVPICHIKHILVLVKAIKITSIEKYSTRVLGKN